MRGDVDIEIAPATGVDLEALGRLVTRSVMAWLRRLGRGGVRAHPEHDQRSPAQGVETIALDGRSGALERRVLLELVTDPPPEGDDVMRLAARLGAPPAAVQHAVAALEQAGLALRAHGVVRATPAAIRFDELWPIR